MQAILDERGDPRPGKHPHPNPPPLAGGGNGRGLSSEQPQRTDPRPTEVGLVQLANWVNPIRLPARSSYVVRQYDVQRATAESTLQDLAKCPTQARRRR